MAWNKIVAMWIIIVLFYLNAVWTVYGDSADDDRDNQAWGEMVKLSFWCLNRRIIFNSTENCEFNILSKELCSSEIVSSYNRELQFYNRQHKLMNNNVTLEEMVGDWKGTSWARHTNPYDTCKNVGMIVEGYGFGTSEHTQAPPAPGNETSETFSDSRDSDDYYQALGEWVNLRLWCLNRRIIFNSTENCELNILNKELCSFEIVSLYNRELKLMNNVTLKEMVGDWKEPSLGIYTNPYDTCIKVGMIVEGYGFGTSEHTQAPPAPGNETSENHGSKAIITQPSNFSFGFWGCLVIVLGLAAFLLTFFILLARQNPGFRAGGILDL